MQSAHEICCIFILYVLLHATRYVCNPQAHYGRRDISQRLLPITSDQGTIHTYECHLVTWFAEISITLVSLFVPLSHPFFNFFFWVCTGSLRLCVCACALFFLQLKYLFSCLSLTLLNSLLCPCLLLIVNPYRFS